MHFEIHSGKCGVHRVDAIEYSANTPKVDRVGLLLEKVILYDLTRLRDTSDIILDNRRSQIMFHSSDKELLTYDVPLLKLLPQDFYAAACGILRHTIARAKRQRLVVTFEGGSYPLIKHAVDTIGRGTLEGFRGLLFAFRGFVF